MAVLLFFMALSILSLNCNGLHDSSKRAGLVQWFRSLAVVVDIVCLQETHCSSVSEVRLGLLPLVCRVWCLLVPPGLVVVSCCIVLVCLL